LNNSDLFHSWNCLEVHIYARNKIVVIGFLYIYITFLISSEIQKLDPLDYMFYLNLVNYNTNRSNLILPHIYLSHTLSHSELQYVIIKCK